MINFISKILALIAKYFISFVVILLVLVVGTRLSFELKSAFEVRTRLTQLQTAHNDFEKDLLAVSNSLEQKIQAMAMNNFGESASKEISAMLSNMNVEKNSIESRKIFGIPSSVDDFRRLSILEMEIAALSRLKDKVKEFNSRSKSLNELNAEWTAKSNKHNNLLKKYGALSVEIDKVLSEHRYYATLNPLSEAFKIHEELVASRGRVRDEANVLKGQIEGIQSLAKLRQKELDDAYKVASTIRPNVELALKTSKEFITGKMDEKSHESGIFWTLAEGFEEVVEAQLWTAFFVLLSVILVPIGIKLTFFYVIAPLASRRPPIQVVSDTHAVSPMASSGAAEVSLSMLVKPGEEILVQADHLQSSSVKARKSTRWFLNSSYPITSIVSGMLALTRIAPETEERVVVSSGKGTEMRLSAIELPSGADVVLQPRCLVGVVQRCTQPVRIESVWRVFSIHSWLTLQFRYLVFHGPVKIIVKGSRGVHLEASGDGRMINQSATLGFSANAKYSVRRCETFWAYWRGVEDLFNDQFDGAGCVYLYEEMPGLNRKSGITGRGLEGMTDAVLKVFGI